jgi:putative transposase
LAVLLRLAYLAVTNAIAVLRLLSMGDRDKDVEILALRYQVSLLEQQLGTPVRVRFAPEEHLSCCSADLVAREVLWLRLLVRLDTVLRPMAWTHRAGTRLP